MTKIKPHRLGMPESEFRHPIEFYYSPSTINHSLHNVCQ